MTASTIAEIYVQEDGVRVELEIGGADIPAFQNLLPDEIYEKLGLGEEPLADRLLKFFREDFQILVGEGEPLLGEIRAIRPQPRVRRDEVTGEPLPPDGELQIVIFAEIFYPLEERPERIGFQPSSSGRGQASVGFVVYHQGVAVNDFRYLTPGYVLHLDWEDPWYSAFDQRALRRAYWAPMSGFLYVEPFEVRKEIIVRPMDLQRWLDLGLTDREVIAAADQPEMLRKVAEFLRPRHKVVIDGVAVTPELARVNFLRRTLKSSTVVDPPEDIPLRPATIGVIFVYPTDGLPQQVTMEWDLFDDKITQVPCAAVDQAGPLPSFATPDDPVLTWTNFLKQPYLPRLVPIGRPNSGLLRVIADSRYVYAGAFALVAGLLILWIVRHRYLGLKTIGSTVVMLALIPTVLFMGGRANLNEEKSRALVGGILHNVYTSFDFRDEDRVYDFLDKTVVGDLLDRIYLETRKSLELESQGGARTKVKSVELVDLGATTRSKGGIVMEAAWTVTGSIGHWGHVHQRRNRYKAKLTLMPVDGEWKLADVEVIEEERL